MIYFFSDIKKTDNLHPSILNILAHKITNLAEDFYFLNKSFLLTGGVKSEMIIPTKSSEREESMT